MKKTRIVTHNGDFHCDEICAVAILQLALGNSTSVEVVRTRDEKEIATADYVVDVGGVYDIAKNLFDHHQVGGAGGRENGIPYAACGLVWKHFGEKICGSASVANTIDSKMITPIDAIDNGISIFTPIVKNIRPYAIQDIFSALSPTWRENDDMDAAFFQCVSLAGKIIEREIKNTQDEEIGSVEVEKLYHAATDKRLIIMDKEYPWHSVLLKFSEPLFVVYQDAASGKWRLKAVRKNQETFENRKDLPESWAGKRGKDLQDVTGVKDAFFCHSKRFIAVADSKEGILAMAREALA